MQVTEQLQHEITQLQQQATEQQDRNSAELSGLKDAKAMLQQNLDKAMLDLEASSSAQADLTTEVNQWKGRFARLQKVTLHFVLAGVFTKCKLLYLCAVHPHTHTPTYSHHSYLVQLHSLC